MLWRMRFLLLGITVLALVGTIVQTISGLQPQRTNVVVSAGPLKAGSTLTTEDLHTVAVDTALLPEGYLSQIEEGVGQVLVASIPEGLPLPRSMLLSSDFLDSAPAGHVIVSVTVQADGTESLAQPGSTVSLYAPAEEFSETTNAVLVAENAVVVGVGAQATEGGFMSESSSTVVLFVSIPTNVASVVLGYDSATAMRIVLHRTA